MFKRNHWTWIIHLVCTLVLIVIGSWIDLRIERSFFESNGGKFHSDAFLEFVYDYGPLPAEIIAIGAVFGLFFKKWRKPALLLVLTMIIGAGALVHATFKDHWGRPRPRQVIEFGGKQEFRPFYSPNFFNQPENSKSFPCGHCSMGFYFFAFAALGIRYRKRGMFWLGLLTALILGGLLGWIRMAQGGHFFTDIFFSGLIMWMTVLVLDWLIWGLEDENERVN